MHRRTALTLPPSLQRRLDAAARQALYPASGPIIDFSRPPGEPALVGPESVSWQIFKNPLALFVGGVTAVVLEFAHPAVRTGVWEHTSFRTNPRARVQRTGLAALMTVYGPRSETEAMIAGVRRLHGRISGVTPAGIPYRADDPELLSWVHATAGFGIREAYSRYVRRLSLAESDCFTAEGAASARLYGASGAPTSAQACDTLFERMLPSLEASTTLCEFLAIMQRAPVLPRPLAPLQRMLVRAAVDLVPASIRERLELDASWGLTSWQLQLVQRAGVLAERLILRSSPAVQSCLRLGLPEDFLYTAA
jgi:uncharacterized protein (DUF2236 family)